MTDWRVLLSDFLLDNLNGTPSYDQFVRRLRHGPSFQYTSEPSTIEVHAIADRLVDRFVDDVAPAALRLVHT